MYGAKTEQILLVSMVHLLDSASDFFNILKGVFQSYIYHHYFHW